MRLPKFLRRTEVPEAPSDLFDIYHERTMTALVDTRGLAFGRWSPSDAGSAATAPRFLLGLLRSRPDLRKRFPRAVVGDPAYREWLKGEGARELKLPSSTAANLGSAFPADPGAALREFFLHTPEVQWRYPLGLLPVGQKRFAKWLVGKGRAEHGCSDEEILWFLHATAEDLPRHIALTYLILPDWQERFPEARTDASGLLAWLHAEFPKYAPLRAVKTLPPLAPNESSANRAGVNFLSHFCYSSGIRQAAVEAAAALETAGFEISRRDVPTGVRTELAPRTAYLGFEDFPVTITNVAPEPHFAVRYQRAGLPRRARVQIAYWAWELDAIPAEWAPLAEELDEVWAPTPFVAEALRTQLTVPVRELLPPVALPEVEEISRAELGLDPGEFVFLFLFDMASDFRRKNPLAVVRAFQRVFGPEDAATLVIKVSRGSYDAANLARLREEAGAAKIVLVDEVTTRPRACGYISLADCLVSLHRSEGFGLVLAEAMLLGKPVIATNYSGNTAFMNAQNSLLVDYELVPIAEDGGIYRQGYRWAEPSEDHAARLMRWVFQNRAAARAIGERAAEEMRVLLAPAAAGERMRARIEELLAPGLDRGSAG